MTTTVKAIFEAGLLRPLTPLELREGEEVDMTINSRREAAPPDPKQVAKILAEIAAMSVEPKDGSETGSIDHDKILYGEHGAR